MVHLRLAIADRPNYCLAPPPEVHGSPPAQRPPVRVAPGASYNDDNIYSYNNDNVYNAIIVIYIYIYIYIHTYYTGVNVYIYIYI